MGISIRSKGLIKYLGEVESKIKLIEKQNDDVERDSQMFAYRGESKDYGRTKLMPSLFRDSSYVSKEKLLFDLLSDYGVISKDKKGNVEKAIDAQHYVAISRMLDITFSVLSAFFFACSSDKNEDGKVYIFCFPEHYSPNSMEVESFYDSILQGKSIAYSKNFMVFSHSYSNERIKLQKGGFIFFQGREFSPINPVYYETITILNTDKDFILKDLNLLFGITDATIYPEKEHQAALAKQKFENKNGRYKEEKGKIINEIHTYFERMQYECIMYKKKQGAEFNIIEYLRLLRKEQEDLVAYIDLNFNAEIDGDRIQCIKYANESFEILREL